MKVMKYLYWLPLIFFACNNNSSKKEEVPKNLITIDSGKLIKPETDDSVALAQFKLPEDTLIAGKRQFTYIKSVEDTSGRTYIMADYIQWLDGKKAIEAAKKHGVADTSYALDGTIADISVSNGYYILNENSLIRKLLVSRQVVIRLVFGYGGDEYAVNDNSLVSLIRRVSSNSPFIITIRDNEVVKIEEVYIP